MHAWIRSLTHRWATFIENRTSQIQSILWRYVPTSENPVDCAFHGLYTTELLKHPMWGNGPAFLVQDHSTWPIFSATAVTGSPASIEMINWSKEPNGQYVGPYSRTNSSVVLEAWPDHGSTSKTRWCRQGGHRQDCNRMHSKRAACSHTQSRR